MPHEHTNTDPKQKTPPKPTIQKVDEIGDILQRFGKSMETIFGAPSGVPEPVPARVGGAPPQLSTPPFSTAGAGAMSAPQAAVAPSPGVPTVGALRTGVEFNTQGGRTGAVVAGSIQNIAEAVHGFAQKRNEDNITKAQNWLQMYQTALAQGDNYTADLLKKDPKVVKAWEKYLKMEFPKVEKVDIPATSGRPGANLEVPIPMGGQAGHGGRAEIVSPKPNVDQQLAAASKNAMLAGIQSGDPRAIAKMYGSEYNITPDEFKQHTRAQFGLDLTPVQVSMMEAKDKELLMTLKTDVVREAMREVAQFQREMSTTGLSGEYTLEAAKVRGELTLKGVQEHVAALKNIAELKPDKFISGMYENMMKSYTSMINNAQTNLSRKDLDSDYRTKLEADLEKYQQGFNEAKKASEGMKLLKELGIDNLMRGPQPQP